MSLTIASQSTPMSSKEATFSKDKPFLLCQLEMMMENFDTITGSPDPNDKKLMSALQQRIFQSETCRSVLSLFVSNSGVYKVVLAKVCEHVFSLVDDLVRELNRVPNEQLKPMNCICIEGTAGEVANESNPSHSEQKLKFALKRIEQLEEEIRQLVDQANSKKSELEQTTATLHAENTKLKELIEYQATKLKRTPKGDVATPPPAREDLINGLALKCRNDELMRDLAESLEHNEELNKKIHELKNLNGKYARQVLELAARIRVFNEQNEKYSVLLSLQHDEKLATEKENELLRAELVDLNRFHQLRENLEGESGSLTQAVEPRSIRYGMGSNPSVPRHLQFCGLMNRVAVPKDAALTLVYEVLAARSVQTKGDFPTFIHNHLTRKHGVDAAAWAYSLDEATRFYDSDCNLALFGLVSRRTLSEKTYREIITDIRMLLEGCEVMDKLQHQEVRMTVPVQHLMGLLVEMYPGYPDSAFRRMVEKLQKTMTTNSHVHYRMLFPNLERDELLHPDLASTTNMAAEIRHENPFSLIFKELMIDDFAVTMQHLEDCIMRLTPDKVTPNDITSAVGTLFETPSVANEMVQSIKWTLKESVGVQSQVMSMPKQMVVSVLRTRSAYRKGVIRDGAAQTNTPQRAKSLINSIDYMQITGESLLPLNYRQVMQSLSSKRQTLVPADDMPEAAA